MYAGTARDRGTETFNGLSQGLARGCWLREAGLAVRSAPYHGADRSQVWSGVPVRAGRWGGSARASGSRNRSWSGNQDVSTPQLGPVTGRIVPRPDVQRPAI